MKVERVVSARQQPRGRPNQPKKSRTPRVIKLLRKAIGWQGLLESGEVRGQAEVVRREGITRARVTQVTAMPRLAPEIREHIPTTLRTLWQRGRTHGRRTFSAVW